MNRFHSKKLVPVILILLLSACSQNNAPGNTQGPDNIRELSISSIKIDGAFCPDGLKIGTTLSELIELGLIESEGNNEDMAGDYAYISGKTPVSLLGGTAAVLYELKQDTLFRATYNFTVRSLSEKERVNFSMDACTALEKELGEPDDYEISESNGRNLIFAEWYSEGQDHSLSRIVLESTRDSVTSEILIVFSIDCDLPEYDHISEFQVG